MRKIFLFCIIFLLVQNIQGNDQDFDVSLYTDPKNLDLDFDQFNVIWYQTDAVPILSESHNWQKIQDVFKELNNEKNDVNFMKIEENAVYLTNKLIIVEKQQRDISCLLEPTYGQQYKPLKTHVFQGKNLSNFDIILDFVNRITKAYLDIGKQGQSDLGKRIQDHETAINNHNLDSDRVVYLPPNQINRESFINYYLLNQLPFVIIDGATEWIKQNKEKYSKEGLRQRMGNKQVHLKGSGNGVYEGAEDLSLWIKEGDRDNIPSYVQDRLVDKEKVLVRPFAIDVTLNEALDCLEQNGNEKKLLYKNKYGGFEHIENANFYVEYLDIPSYLPELQESLADLIPDLRFLKGERKQFWLGGGDTTSKLHFDPLDNFMVVLQGKKQFTLISPKHSEQLKEGHLREVQWGKKMINENQDWAYYLDRTDLLESTSLVNTPVDDFSDFVKKEITLEEGDILYLPPWYWHEVSSSKSEETGLSMAVNFWYDPVYKKEFPCHDCRRTFDSVNYEFLFQESQQPKTFKTEL